MDSTNIRNFDPLSLIENNISDIICIHNVDGRYRYVTGAVCAILGYSPEELKGTSPYEYFHPGDIKRIARDSHEWVLEGMTAETRIEYRFRKKDGSYSWLQTQITSILDSDRVVIKLLTVSRDINDRKRAEQALQELNTKLEDEAKKRQTAQEALQELNTKLEDEAKKRQAAQEALQELNTKLEDEAKKRQAAQEALQELNTKLEDEATKRQTDLLTGAFTRRRLLQLGENEISRSRKLKDPFSVLMLDIDFLKIINDTYGHAAGDKVLTSAIQTVTGLIRDIDIVGRLGGDEFVVVFPGIGIEEAYIIAERLRKNIETHSIEWESEKIFVQVSIGVIEWLEQDIDFTNLLKRVDCNLYKAKRNGRNMVVCDGFKNG